MLIGFSTNVPHLRCGGSFYQYLQLDQRRLAFGSGGSDSTLLKPCRGFIFVENGQSEFFSPPFDNISLYENASQGGAGGGFSTTLQKTGAIGSGVFLPTTKAIGSGVFLPTTKAVGSGVFLPTTKAVGSGVFLPTTKAVGSLVITSATRY